MFAPGLFSSHHIKVSLLKLNIFLLFITSISNQGKNMNRLVFLRRMFLLFILVSGVAYSQITLTMPSVTGAQGTTITNAPVLISDITGKNIQNFQFQINYDPTVITIYGTSTSGTLAGAAGTTNFIDTTSATGVMRMSWASSNAMTGSGTLLYLKIRIKGTAGSTAITYAATGTYPSGSTFTSIFGDGSNAVTAVNGTAQVGSNTPLTLTVTSANGTVAKNPDQATYTYGTNVTLTATPNTGYTFSNWSGDIASTLNPVTVSMTTNKNIVANYAINTYTLTVNAANGTVVKSPDQATYNYGSTVLLTATPAAGYTFSGWSGDASGTANPLSVTMSSNKNITASFAANVAPTLTLSPAGPYAVDEGSALTITAVGNDVNVGDVLVYSYTSSPTITGATFNTSTGVFSWTPKVNEAGTYTLTFKVTDGKVTTPTQVVTTVTVNKVNLPPTLTLSPAGPYLVYENESITITLNGSDPNTGDVLTYSISSPTTLPTGAKLTGNVFTWNPIYGQGTTDPYNFTFKVKDQSGLSATVSIMIIVGKSNRAPSFTAILPAGIIAQVNKPAPIIFTFTYKATDPDNDKLTFSLISGPTGAAITSDGVFTWGPTVDQAGKSYVVTVQVSDGTVNLQTSQTITASSTITGIKNTSGIPSEYSLEQNYPNPFNPTTTINYSLPQEGFVKIAVYDVLGKEIAVLVNRNVTAGYHSVNFDASQLHSGLYFYRIQANNFMSTKKMMLTK